MKAFRMALSYLLVFCMAVSCGSAAFAETVNADSASVKQGFGDVTESGTGAEFVSGLQVTAENGYSAEVTAGSVSAHSEDGGSSGVSAQAFPDSTVEVTTGSVTSVSDNDAASGAGVSNSFGNSSLTVQGDVSAAGKTGAFGVGASEANVASVTVEGNVTAASDATAMGIVAGRAYDEDIMITGNVTADAGSENADGIFILTDHIDDLHTTVTVGGNVHAESDGKDAVGVNTSTGNISSTTLGSSNSSSEVHVGGSISAESVAGDATGIYSYISSDSSDSSSTVIVDGYVSAETTDGWAQAILVTTKAGNETNVTVGQDVSASSENSGAGGVLVQTADGKTSIAIQGNVTADAGDYAIGASITESADTDITINGNVTVTGDSAVGVVAARAQDSSITVNGNVTATADTDGADGVHVFGNLVDGLDSAVTINGNVTATSQHGEADGIKAEIEKDSENDITVTGNVSAYSDDKVSTGISAAAIEDGETEITVEGTVSAESGNGSAYGVSATASTDGEVEVTIEKGINVRNHSKNTSTGITADATHDSEIEITVESGGVSVTSTLGQNSNGIYANARSGSEISMDITGDVRSEAEIATGIHAESGGEDSSTDITVHGNVEAVSNPDTPGASYGIMAVAETGGSTTVTVDGDVTSTLSGLHMITMDGSSSGLTETIQVNIGGDLTSGDYAIIVNDSPDNTAVFDAVVAGTVHGDKGAIVVSPLVDAEELTLTLWQVDIPESGEIIKEFNAGLGGEAAATEKTKEMEQNILYIIKVEEASSPAVALNGTTLSHGWDTAKEGQIVTLTAKNGYEILGAYNGLGEKIPLKQDKDGNYYVVVPRGGGVYLSVSMNAPFIAGPWWYGETAPVTVSFDLDGGKIGEDEGPIVIDTWIGNYIHLPEAPEKEGCTFAYWKEILPEEETAEKEPLKYRAGQSLQILGDMRFIAVWEASENT